MSSGIDDAIDGKQPLKVDVKKIPNQITPSKKSEILKI